MKKLLLLGALTSLSLVGKTEVRILEDNSVITREGDVIKVSLQQTFSKVPSVPCFADFVERYDRPEGLKFWGKVGFFFKNFCRQFTWKKCAYSLGGIVLSGAAYKVGKKAHTEYYGNLDQKKVSGWFNN